MTLQRCSIQVNCFVHFFSFPGHFLATSEEIKSLMISEKVIKSILKNHQCWKKFQSGCDFVVAVYILIISLLHHYCFDNVCMKLILCYYRCIFPMCGIRQCPWLSSSLEQILKGYLAITFCSQIMYTQRLKNARNTPDTLKLVMLLSF